MSISGSKKITDLNLLTYSNMSPDDLMVINDSSAVETKRTTILDITTYAISSSNIQSILRSGSFSGSFSGSHFGTSSYSNNSLSSSYALTASYAQNSDGSGLGTSLSQTYTIGAHTFYVGDLIKRIPGGFDIANNDKADNSEVFGIITSTTSTTITVVTDGVFTLSSTPQRLPPYSISDASTYFLYSSGSVTTIDPSALFGVSKPVFIGISGTSGLLINERGLQPVSGSDGNNILASSSYAATASFLNYPNSSTSSYAISASYALSAGNSATSTYATSAGTATSALTAIYATTAGSISNPYSATSAQVLTISNPFANISYGNYHYVWTYNKFTDKVYLMKQDQTTNNFTFLYTLGDCSRHNVSLFKFNDGLDYLIWGEWESNRMSVYSLTLDTYTTYNTNNANLGHYKTLYIDELTDPGYPQFYMVSSKLGSDTSANYNLYRLYRSGANYISATIGSSFNLRNTNIYNSAAFLNLEPANFDILMSVYNPVKKRLYILSNGSGLLHIFDLNRTASDLLAWWNQAEPTRAGNLSYIKSISVPYNEGYWTDSDNESYSIEYNTTTGNEEFICFNRRNAQSLNGTAAKIPWFEG